MLQVNVAASDGAGDINEDFVGHAAHAAWVIDGATGLGGRLMGVDTDAAWFARRIGALLAMILRERPSIPTHALLTEAMETCRDEVRRDAIRTPVDTHELPSAAFAMVRQYCDRIEFTTLGDCRIAYVTENGSARLFGTTALETLEARTIALAERIRRESPAIDGAGLRALLEQHDDASFVHCEYHEEA